MTRELDEKMVKKVAELARLAPDQKEVSDLRGHLTRFLGHVEELQEVSTDQVAPLENPLKDFNLQFAQDLKLRDDKVDSSLGAQSILQNAPEQRRSQFRVDAYWEEE